MLRKLFCIFIAGAATSVFFFAAILATIFFGGDASIWVCRRLWSPVLLWAGGARLVVYGQENVDARRPTIYVANHQSTLDIPALFIAVPVSFRYVAKSQLAWVPFIGWYLWFANHVFVNRSNRKAAIDSLQAAGRKIRAGTSIFLYPEGTRSPDGRILPFKKGPFALALEARVAICPVTIEGTRKIMPKNSWNIVPGPVYVKIGKPVSTEGFAADDREGLAKAIREVIIAQNLELGGLGGDVDTAVAPAGYEGISQGPSLDKKLAP